MNRLLQSPIGAILARPWVDEAGLLGARRWYLPLSRLWSAANAAGDEPGRFRSEVGAPLSGLWPDAFIRRQLRRNVQARDAAMAARAEWEEATFDDDRSAAQLRVLDERRRTVALRHLLTRGLFYPLLFPQRPPLARWRIAGPAALDSALAGERHDPARRYRQPFDVSSIVHSGWFDNGSVRESWLRAPTPSTLLGRWPGSGRLYARIVEPHPVTLKGGQPHGTLILGSGLCLETDIMPGAKDAGLLLAALGWRTVEPVSPFHGLRAEADRYGGEPFFADAPLAAFELISAQALESAMLIAWLRGRFGGPVALGGISMTSFVAQQAASYCDAWPAEARPDGVLLISHSGRIQDVTFGGTLAAMLGLDRQLTEAGWTPERLADFATLIDPVERPALAPERIVSVLGQTDKWLPYADGLDVARRWRLPEENIFRYPLGHLGMPVQLMRDTAPFERLRRVLEPAI